jgi:hypothetical protein
MAWKALIECRKASLKTVVFEPKYESKQMPDGGQGVFCPPSLQLQILLLAASLVYRGGQTKNILPTLFATYLLR